MKKSITRIFIFGILFNSYIFGLTSGPSQPEYYGFTPSTTEGMVDLLTGDFTYSIPLLEIPGPSLSLPFTLGYRSGIQLEQEASWVGLGWSLCPGSINRSVNRYADDYYGGRRLSNIQFENKVSGLDASVGVSAYGIGISVNFGKRSDQGYRGHIDVSVVNKTIGIWDWNERDGYETMPAENINLFCEIMGMIEWYISTAASGVYESITTNSPGNGESGLSSMGINLISYAVSLAKGMFTISGSGIGISSRSITIGAFHSKSLSIPIGKFFGIGLGFARYKYWIYKDEVNSLYGYLYLNNYPTDKFDDFLTEDLKMEYSYAPQLLPRDIHGCDDIISGATRLKAFPMSTPDNYRINAEGISTVFRPYHQEIGDYFGLDRHECPVPEWFDYVISKWWGGLFQARLEKKLKKIRKYIDKRVGVNATEFVHEVDPIISKYGDKYPMVIFREIGAPGGTMLCENWREVREPGEYNPANQEDDKYRWMLKYRERKNNEVNYWPKQYRSPYLPTWKEYDNDNRIEYYQTTDPNYTEIADRISNAIGIFPKFQDIYDHKNTNGEAHIPYKALVGFTVVRPDGMIYEFHKTVFTFFHKVFSLTIDPGEKKEKRSRNYLGFGDYRNSDIIKRAYAHSWLLTAMKAPDYVDSDGRKGVTDGDIGGWIRFEYNKHIPSYHYRNPYEGLTPTGTGEDAKHHNSYYLSYGQASWGAKEIYYLTDVFTATHHVNFVLSDRDDGKELWDEKSGFALDADDKGLFILCNFLLPEKGDKLNISFRYNYGNEHVKYTGIVEVIDEKYIDDTLNINYYFSKYNGGKAFRKIYIEIVEPQLPIIYQNTSFYPISLKFANREKKSCQQKIDEICLYTRTFQDISSPSDGILDDDKLIKVVKFKYSSDFNDNRSKQLCPGIPNSYSSESNTGKLTLRQVIIGDGENFIPPYEFSYYMEGDKAPYNRFDWDRWGYYKNDGGHILTKLDRNNIVEWDSLLYMLRDQSSYWGQQLLTLVAEQLNNEELNVILNPETTEENGLLLGRHKNAIGEALNKLVHNLYFFQDHSDYLNEILKEIYFYEWRYIPGLPGYVFGCKNFKHPKTICMWSNYFRTDPEADPPEPELITITKYGNGNFEASLLNPFTEDHFDSNSVYALNLCVVCEYAFLINRESIIHSVDEEHRIIMAHLDSDRFDHNTNPEDVKAWSLKTIAMPSGAEIDIEYESDDYTYVGRTRVVAPSIMEGFGNDISDIVKNDEVAPDLNIEGMDYFKCISQEKDIESNYSYLRFGGWDVSYKEKFIEKGDDRWEDLEIRVMSVFRVYRDVSEDPNEHDWQINPDFEKIRDWQKDGKHHNPYNGENYRLHLIALFDPFQFISVWMNFTDVRCGVQKGYTENGEDNYFFGYIPIDLGPIIGPETGPDNEPEEKYQGFIFPDKADFDSEKEYNDEIAKVACQRGYVDFKLSRLNDKKYWEHRWIQNQYGINDIDYYDPLHAEEEHRDDCFISAFNIAQQELWFPEMSPPNLFLLTWARKLDLGTGADNEDIDINVESIKYYDYENNITTEEAAVDGELLDICYKYDKDGEVGPADPIYNGYLSWRYLQEFGTIRSRDSYSTGNVLPFEKKYWDFYSTNAFVKKENPVVAGHVVGIPGGGVRVKKLTFNTGWPQTKGSPSNARVVEYAYVCEASDGKLGNFSSGATPTEPPPYSNKGDDRADLLPQVGLLKGTPNVIYGTVHELRKGRGRIVDNYLTCADIDNFITDDESNYYCIDPETQQPREILGAYDVDMTSAESILSAHHRWKANICSQFQGLPINEKKYSEDGKLVMSKNMRYHTSLTADEICALEIIGFMNNVSSRVKDVLVPQENLNIFACNNEYKLRKHNLSNHIGKSVERLRQRWINYNPHNTHLSESLHFHSDYWEIYIKNHEYFELYGLNEMEINEHSVRQYSIRELQYAGDNPQYGKGVGTTTFNTIFDFYTGQPIVTSVTEAQDEESIWCSSEGSGDFTCESCSENDNSNDETSVIKPKTTVSIPAYWINGNESCDDYSSMGPLFWHSEHRNALLGNEESLEQVLSEQKNMLTQIYSNSVYSGLKLPCCSKKCLPEEIPYNMTKEKYCEDYVMKAWKECLSLPRDNEETRNNDFTFDDDFTLLKRNYTFWKEYGEGDRKTWRISEKKDLRVPMDKETKKMILSQNLITQLGPPYNTPSMLGELYITTEKQRQYDNYGNLIELMDANNNYLSNFYHTRYKNIYMIGQVLNSNRNSCRLLNVDEVFDVPKDKWPEGWESTSADITSDYARSGEYSLDLSTGKVYLTLDNVSNGKKYELSFWIRNPDSRPVVNGFGNKADIPAYKQPGPEWQRVVLTGDAPTGQITIEANSGYIDDIRFIPEDAQAYTITVNNKGWMTSYADANDVISYYNYDSFGRLIEVKDKQGVLISTQSQVEGKK